MDESPWFLTNGEWRMGPLTLADAAEVLGRGHRAGEVLAWREGMDSWVPVERVAELVAAPRPTTGWPSTPPVRQAAAAAPDTAWFLVGGTKLVVMCVVTFGLYEIYWFYQQWRCVRLRGEAIYPVVRTFFAGLFCYALFRRVAESATTRGLPAPSPGWYTIVFILLSVTWQLPAPWRLLSLLSLGPLVVVQRAASAAALAETPAADPNTKLTPANWFGVGVFTVVLLLALLGALLPPPAPSVLAPGPTTTAQSGQGDLQPRH